MQTRHAEGYLLAVASFLVCCWVNPNDAIPYRSRLQAKEQVDHWVGNRAEIRAVNDAHREFRQQDVGVDEISDLSGGGTKWTTSQRLRSHRSRIKDRNMNTNINIIRVANEPSAHLSKINQLNGRFPKINQQTSRLRSIVDAATHDASKTNMEPALITEVRNCSEHHNANNRYSSSFNVNSATETLNVGDDSQVAGEAGTKITTSVLVGEDITLCWIETTTIKEDRSLHPVQRFVIREYTISFENSATIPERYLECVQVKGEIDKNNNSIPRSTLFEIMDENTRHSRVVNFTTVSHSDHLTVWQHKQVRCGVGPVVTKNIIEWDDERSETTKRRVEIKVSPKIHRLTAQPTDTKPRNTDPVDLQLTSSPPTNLSSVNCGPGIPCGSYSDCVDENCQYYTNPSEGSTSLDLQEATTQSYMTTPAADGERDKSTNATDDRGFNELLSSRGIKELLLVTDKMINSSQEMTTPILVTTEATPEDSGLSTVAPVEVTTIVDDESWTTTSDFEISNSTESGSAFSTTTHKTNNSMKIGKQEVEMPAISEEVCLSTSENGDLCTDSVSEDSTTSSEDSSNSDIEFTNTVHRDDETRNTADFTTTPTTDASEFTTENETDYLSEEEWETTVGIVESKSSNPITETTENNVTSVGVTEDSNTVMKIMGSGSTITEITESSTTMTELIDGTIAIPTEPSEITAPIPCDNRYDDCAKSFEITNSQDQTELPGSGFEPTTMLTMTTRTLPDVASKRLTNMHSEKNKTEFGLLEFSTTEISISEIGVMNEDTTNETLSTQLTSKVFTTKSTTAQEPLPVSCESGGNCDFSFKSNISDVTPAVIALETRSGDKVTTAATTTDISSAITEVIITSTTLGGETISKEATTVISDASLKVTEPETRSHAKASAEEFTTESNESVPEVKELETGLGNKTTTKNVTTDAGGATTEVTISSTTPGGEAIAEETTTDLSNTTSEITASSTTEEGQSQFTVFSSRRTTETLTGIYTGESTTHLGDAATEVTTYTTDSSSESKTDIVSSTTIKQSSTFTDSSGKCENIGTGNCTIASEVADVPPTTASTPIEVANISTTVSDVLTTVGNRTGTTVKVMSKSPNSKNKLALKIKILLEHIDENKNKQKLVEVEKHLLFNVDPNEHSKESIMKQVRLLNNTVSIEALFNCSSVEKLTGDVSDFAANCFTLYDEIPHDKEHNSDFNSTEGFNMRKSQYSSPRVQWEVDRNVQMSLPGIHDDIHAGLSHVLTRVPPEHETERQNVEMSKQKISHSRLLKVVADPQDERVHARKKKQTIDDLTIDQLDLPKDFEEVDHWSSERVRRAIDSGHVRTLTEFTIYEDP